MRAQLQRPALQWLTMLLSLSVSRTFGFSSHHHHSFIVAPSSTKNIGAVRLDSRLQVSQYSNNLSSSGSSNPDNDIDLDSLDGEVASIIQYNQKMLRQAEEEHKLLYQSHMAHKRQQNPQQEHADNLFLTTQQSFQNVESMSENLFTNQPLVALVLFVSCGLLVAYVSGIVFLDGYISSLNPAMNGDVPYWDEDVPTDEDSILLLNSLYEVKGKLPSLRFWD